MFNSIPYFVIVIVGGGCGGGAVLWELQRYLMLFAEKRNTIFSFRNWEKDMDIAVFEWERVAKRERERGCIAIDNELSFSRTTR